MTKLGEHWDTVLISAMLLALVGLFYYMLLPAPQLAVTIEEAGQSTFAASSPMAQSAPYETVDVRAVKKTPGRGTIPIQLHVNVNTASPTELDQLPGIGTKRAQAIVAFRQAHGSFDSLEQLLEVKGIGPTRLQKLRPYISLTD